MSHSLAKIYLHIVFSTKHRLALIDERIENELHAYLGGICNKHECYPVKIGGYWDHVHLLCLLSKKISVINLIENLKSSSSGWIKKQNVDYENFYWQSGYGAFSVGLSDVGRVKTYIENQHEHHKTITFQDEFRELLRSHHIDYDERYVWD
jgi:REP element-mobilizing transposase RayT